MAGAKKSLQVMKVVNWGLFIFFIVLPNVDFDTSVDYKFIPIIEKHRKKRKCLIFRFRCNNKILLTRIILHNFVVFVAKSFWVFITCTVHRNKLIDIFINNIDEVINKNLSLLFFPSDIKLAWKAKQKKEELTKNQVFFVFLFFFSKNSGFKEIKTTIFERGYHKFFLSQLFFKQALPCRNFIIVLPANTFLLGTF